ncbi:MAG: serine protease [Planctomycetia bacterium]|nr:serine protease [Planctomycetia bacterium]
MKGVSHLETNQMKEESKGISLKWWWVLLGFLLGLVVSIHSCACVQAACEPVRNMEDIHAASCRIFALDHNGRGAIGTGTICGLIDGKYYVLTNWHVVESHKTVVLQFFGEGRIVECRGNVVATWHNETQPYDFAIITIDQRQLTKYDPPFVPLAQRGTRPTTGGVILSSGCSEGRWSLAWKGSIESYYGQTAQFYPAPKGGQSGSAIVEKINGQYYITGILTWRVGDERQLSEEEMRGGAIPISKLYEAFDGKYKTGIPDSVPPNSVWCRIESESEETEKEPVSEQEIKTESNEEAVLRIENESEKEQSQDEAVLRIQPEENKETQQSERTIPNVFPTPSTSDRIMTYAIGNTEDFEAPVAKKEIVEILYRNESFCGFRRSNASGFRCNRGNGNGI